jgi:3-hydroxyisobutyrate dehydrogenase
MTIRIGFIGLGNMGGRMARRLVEAGHHVLGFDPAPDAAGNAGAQVASSIGEVVAGSDHILFSLPDSHVVESVVLGEGGVLESARAGQIVVDLSTAAPASTQMLHARLGEIGIELVDAGISGGAAAAEKGSLTLMVGGSEEALAQLRPTLEPLASKVFRMGGSGAGHSTKLLNNFLNAVNLAASSEVMVAAKKEGLDVEQVLEVINASSGANWATQNRFPSIVRGDYLEGGLTSQLMMKDVVLYLEHLLDIGAPSLNSAGPLSSFGLAIHQGYGDVISNRVVDAIGNLAGGVRLHTDPQL